jgi:hypothetical protein
MAKGRGTGERTATNHSANAVKHGFGQFCYCRLCLHCTHPAVLTFLYCAQHSFISLLY